MPIRPARAVTLGAAAAALNAILAAGALAESHGDASDVVELGPRPLYLVDAMREGELKDTLMGCMGQEPRRTLFSIGHRGAPLQFPEHTVESNVAAARMGAGILECDVAFTADQELVCRHAQDDLHTTTDILLTDLARKCTQPFTAATPEGGATAECRTSDITLAEFRTLQGQDGRRRRRRRDARGVPGRRRRLAHHALRHRRHA